MAVRPVQISLDEKLLRRIDADPESRRSGRSAFVRAAVSLYLRAKERKRIDEAIERAYGGQADALLEEMTTLMESQSWPKK